MRRWARRWSGLSSELAVIGRELGLEVELAQQGLHGVSFVGGQVLMGQPVLFGARSRQSELSRDSSGHYPAGVDRRTHLAR